MPELPELPPPPDPEALAALDDAALEAAVAEIRRTERATLEAMTPYNRHLAEIRARLGEIATEQRRRERAAHVAQRAEVREAAKSGGMPSFAAILEMSADDLPSSAPMQQLRWFLKTGGEVGLGFATRPGAVAFTDGRRQQQTRTLAEAIALFQAGWEPGTPGIPGVRVHLAGSRVERVVPATDVVLAPDGVSEPAPGPPGPR
jgi:hypothetical protein